MPQRIGLVVLRGTGDAGALDDPAALLLADFADALTAYARISSNERSDAAHPSLVHATVPVSTCPSAPPEETMAPRMPSALRECDSVVLALTCGISAAHDAAVEQALNRLAESSLVKDSRAYALIAGASPDGRDGEAAVAACQRQCERGGMRWCGGVAATDAAFIDRLMRAPRLGMWRRPVSQAIDRLVAAVRMGCALDEVDLIAQGAFYDRPDDSANGIGSSPEADTANALVISPHPLWCVVERRLSRRST